MERLLPNRSAFPSHDAQQQWSFGDDLEDLRDVLGLLEARQNELDEIAIARATKLAD